MPGATKAMSNRIIVCGIYRSGTSLTTKLVREWGAYVGKDEDLFQDEYGYLESISLKKLNGELLDNISRVPTPVKTLIEKSKNVELTERARQIMADMDKEAEAQKAPAWAWKAPSIPLVLPFWHGLWSDVIYIVPVRHPVETIHSGGRMEGLAVEDIPLSAGLAYWQFCMLNVLNYTQGNPRKIFIAYDELIKNPLQECARLCSFLDEQCGITPKKADPRIEAMAACISNSEYHHRSSASLADVEVATPEQRALYNFLRVKTMHSQETFNPDDFALYPGWKEYLETMDALVASMSIRQGG
jgi:hypothetical protein